MNLTFTIADFEDLPRIVEIKFKMFAEAGHASLLVPGSQEAIRKDYEELYAKDLARHFVAKTGDGIIASAGAFIKSDLPFCYFDPPHYGFLGDVFTESAYRGRGLATALNKQAIEWLQSKGVAMIRLLASDAGRSIYGKLGFRASDEMVMTNII